MNKTLSTDTTNGADNHSPLVGRTASAAHEAVDALASRLATTEDKLRHVAAESSHRFANSQERAKAQMKRSLQTMKLSTRKNPLIVAGAAFVVGALVAAFFSGGSKRD